GPDRTVSQQEGNSCNIWRSKPFLTGVTVNSSVFHFCASSKLQSNKVLMRGGILGSDHHEIKVPVNCEKC
ncbi:hypothetical protein STEG23_015784, partial [Scotinomys teguina]